MQLGLSKIPSKIGLSLVHVDKIWKNVDEPQRFIHSFITPSQTAEMFNSSTVRSTIHRVSKKTVPAPQIRPSIIGAI